MVAVSLLVCLDLFKKLSLCSIFRHYVYKQKKYTKFFDLLRKKTATQLMCYLLNSFFYEQLSIIYNFIVNLTLKTLSYIFVHKCLIFAIK